MEGPVGHNPHIRYRVFEQHYQRNLVPAAYKRSDTESPHLHLRHINPIARRLELSYVSHASPLSSLVSHCSSYMSSGRSSSEVHDDIWVLSLPQFQWTQVFAGTRPNYGSTCHLVGKKQMLVLGGIDEVHPTVCEESPYVALFEMTNLKWLRSYVKEDHEFRVPKAIYEWIGGS